MPKSASKPSTRQTDLLKIRDSIARSTPNFPPRTMPTTNSTVSIAPRKPPSPALARKNNDIEDLQEKLKKQQAMRKADREEAETKSKELKKKLQGGDGKLVQQVKTFALAATGGAVGARVLRSFVQPQLPKIFKSAKAEDLVIKHGADMLNAGIGVGAIYYGVKKKSLPIAGVGTGFCAEAAISVAARTVVPAINKNAPPAVSGDDDMDVGNDEENAANPMIGYDGPDTMQLADGSVVARTPWGTTVRYNPESTPTVGNDERPAVGNDERPAVGNDERPAVGNDETDYVGNDETDYVGNDETDYVGNDETDYVGNDETDYIGND